MNFLNKMERRFGRYAIKNLPAVMVALYAAGYVMELLMPQVASYLTLEPYYILHGQVWRILTWLIIPPSSLDLFTIIMLMFYFSIGRTLERTWGSFRFNFYILSGVLFTVIGSFVLYGVLIALGYVPTTLFSQYGVVMISSSGGDIQLVGQLFSTYYINMSIFLAFALSYPDMQVLLYFIVPIKMKWMGIVYGVLILFSFINSSWGGRVAIIASLLNFILFFALTRKNKIRRVSPAEIHRRQEFKRSVKKAAPNAGATIHRCAVCGRTEADNPNLEFRYCSKCYGAYEYCQDHLFTHPHVQKPEE